MSVGLCGLWCDVVGVVKVSKVGGAGVCFGVVMSLVCVVWMCFWSLGSRDENGVVGASNGVDVFVRVKVVCVLSGSVVGRFCGYRFLRVVM